MSPDSTTYAVSRLVRGLASSRDSARKGFFTAFVELLKQSSGDDLESVLSKAEATLEDSLKANKGGSKGEEGDALVGQMLARGAMLRSGRAGNEVAGRCVQELVAVAGQRSYLRLPAYVFIVDAVNSEQVCLHTYNHLSFLSFLVTMNA